MKKRATIMCKFQSGVGCFRAADSRLNVTSYRGADAHPNPLRNMHHRCVKGFKKKFCTVD